MLTILILQLMFSKTFCFKLPDLNVHTDIKTNVDSHQEIHDILINSMLSTFELNVNLSSINLTISILILLLIFVINRRQNLVIYRITSQLISQGEEIEMLQWTTGPHQEMKL